MTSGSIVNVVVAALQFYSFLILIYVLLSWLQSIPLAQELRRLGDEARARAVRRQLAAARRFCYGMMYQPGEAYFAEQPTRWVGGVRAEPVRAAVTASACAAAIEAFLAR